MGITELFSEYHDILGITARSFYISISATLIAAFFAIPLGAFLAVKSFRFRPFLIALLSGMMSLPPVLVGLLVYILFTRQGVLGALDLLFTPTAMIIAQVIIIFPIVASLSYEAISRLWEEYRDLLTSMRATPMQQMFTLIKDSCPYLMTACLTGFGRAIGEVGAILIVGGNIDRYTRVLTTAITLETSKGEFALAITLGLILLFFALLINLLLHLLTRPDHKAIC